MTLRVGLVDDHPAIILGTTAILNLQPDMHVVAAARTADEVIAGGAEFDIVLLDLSLGDGTTPERNLRLLAPHAKRVVAYSVADRPDVIRQAVRAGVSAVIRKAEEPDRLVESIRRVAAGDLLVSAEWAYALDSDAPFVQARLTARESEVLSLYASGETADRVAAALFISRDTVYDHIRRIRAKYAELDRPAPTKLELRRRAVEDGIVAPDIAL